MPLLSPGSTNLRLQGLSEVPEEDEVSQAMEPRHSETSVLAEQDSGSGMGRQDTSAIVEENINTH